MPSRVSMTSSATTTRMGAPRGRGGAGVERAAERADAVGEVHRPHVRGAPSSSTSTTRRSRPRRDAHVEERRAAPRRVLDRLDDDDVGRRLDRRRRSGRAAVAELDRQRRLVGERRERGRRARPRSGSPGRCRGRGRAAPRARRRSRRAAASRSAPSSLHRRPSPGLAEREPQVVGQREQPLLRAVVQVALEPAPRGVAGLDDARSRGAQLAQLGERLGPERSFSTASRAAAPIVRSSSGSSTSAESCTTSASGSFPAGDAGHGPPVHRQGHRAGRLRRSGRRGRRAGTGPRGPGRRAPPRVPRGACREPEPPRARSRGAPRATGCALPTGRTRRCPSRGR